MLRLGSRPGLGLGAGLRPGDRSRFSIGTICSRRKTAKKPKWLM
jgi:hypothetical protein